MTENSPLRVVVIGAGAMGAAHCATIVSSVPEMRLTAVCDTHAETAQAVAARFGVPAFTQVADVLAARCADAALIVVPHPLHAAAAIPCLEAGLHVLCEKPLTETVSSADAMLACAHRHGRVLGVNFQRRYVPAWRKAITFVRDGGIGRVIRAQVIIPEFRGQLYFDSNSWRATWRGEGGGVLLNQAAHMLDLFCQVAGLPVCLRGRTETRMHDIEVEDTAEALLTFAGGGSGYVYTSTAEPCGGEMLEVVGECGMVRFRDRRVTGARYPLGVGDFARTTTDVWGKPPAEPLDFGVEEDAPYQDAVLRNFARHILHGTELICDADSGLASLELANAMTLSSALGEDVALPIDRDAYDAVLTELRERSTYQKREVAVARVTDPKFFATRKGDDDDTSL
jgi:predicted dehydrogenase